MDEVEYFKPYEGDEPFIFISYSHRDSEMVMPIISDMNKRGFRIWFDEGIDAGSMWTECIADHLTRAELMLGFVSNEYMNSENCKREMNFAVQKKKKLINIFLTPTELTPGMDLQIGGIWALMKYSFPSEEFFYMKLYNSPLLYFCDLGSAKPIAEEIPEAEAAASIEKNTAEAAEQKPEPSGLKEKLRGMKDKEEGQKGQQTFSDKPAAPKASQTPKKKKSVWKKIITLFAALLIIAGAVLWYLGRQTGLTDRVIKLYFSRTPIVEALPPETVVSFKNEIFEKAAREFCNKPEGELKVSDLSGLSALYICGERYGFKEAITVPVASQNSSHVLVLDSEGKTLEIERGSIQDLSDLKFFPDLKYLQLAFQSIVSLETLPPSSITSINLSSNMLTSLDGISKLPALVELNADYNALKDIGDIAECYKLNTLYLNGSEISNLDPLKTIPSLAKLRISNCNLSTLRPALLPGQLTMAEFISCDLRGRVFDYLDGDGLRNLKFQDCIFDDINDIDRIKAVELWLIRCVGVSDWSLLTQSPSLVELHIDSSMTEFFKGSYKFKLITETEETK